MRFAVAAVRLTLELPKTPAGRHVGGQLLRAATAGGANYAEARSAESRSDFIHKVSIAAKEIRESIYWLELIHQLRWIEIRLIREGRELVSILGASIKTARSKT